MDESTEVRFVRNAEEASPTEVSLAEARQKAIDGLKTAADSASFMRLTNAARSLNIDDMGWMLPYMDSESTVDDWLENFSGSEQVGRWRQEQAIAAILLKKALETEQSSGGVRLVVHAFGEGAQRQTRIMGIFPDGKSVGYDIPRVQEDKVGRDVVYQVLNTACTMTSVDDLLKGDDQPRVFDVDDKDLGDLYAQLGFDPAHGPKENLRIRDDSGEVVGTRDPKSYLLYALKGGFRNERDRFLLSDSPN